MNKNTIPAGLLAILFVIAMIWEIIKIIWPVLVAAVLGVIIYFLYTSVKAKREKEKKERNDKVTKLENQIKQYEKDLIECDNRLNNNPNDAFSISYKEQLPYLIDNNRIELICLTNNKMSVAEKEELNNRKQNNSSFLANYTYIDKETIDQVDLDKFFQLNNTIIALSKSDIWRVGTRQKSSYYFFWGSNIRRNIVSFKKEYFNKIIPSVNCEVYSISILGSTFYFYPKYIIQSKGKNNYRIINYSQLSIKINECVVIEDNYKPKGGVSIGYTYEHTCIDGTPDMRYKYNRKFPKYKYGYINIISLDNFRIDIANYNLANDFYKAIIEIKHTVKRHNKQHNKQNIISPADKCSNSNNNQPSSANSSKSLSGERIGFRNIMCTIIEKEGRDIIMQKRFIYMLEDMHAFKEVPHIKYILNLMQTDGYMEKILTEDEGAIISLLSAQLSQKYMLRIDAVTAVFEDVTAVI